MERTLWREDMMIKFFFIVWNKINIRKPASHSQDPGVSPPWHHTAYLSTEGTGSQHSPTPTFPKGHSHGSHQCCALKGAQPPPAPWSLSLHFQCNAPSALPGSYLLLRGWVTPGLGTGVHTAGCVQYVLKTTDTEFSVFSISHVSPLQRTQEFT